MAKKKEIKMSFLNIYNNEHCSSIMGPRISFSGDFINGSGPVKHEGPGYRDPPVSSDFEFSVSGYSMISAEEAFFKGKLLPLKENCSKILGTDHFQKTTTTTLRDELSVSVNDDEHVLAKIPKSPVRWRERFGLKKAQKAGHKRGVN
ncbi:uncharacterized protein LOC124928786 [Impatiens glandulifera]|uniref:uncharacterized protein LOC124928786 n=1 Tax=Impatiens glandulifera TaxID=253017 RepID=UPI001FB190BD|nr:uncharacterized protein LOC124928786 [Impatiens glandulifera]